MADIRSRTVPEAPQSYVVQFRRFARGLDSSGPDPNPAGCRMNFGFTELLIILAILIVIFGANRLPELGRGIGRGIRNFKEATKEGADKSDERPERT